jgi:hypothetical protein
MAAPTRRDLCHIAFTKTNVTSRSRSRASDVMSDRHDFPTHPRRPEQRHVVQPASTQTGSEVIRTKAETACQGSSQRY